MPPASIQLEISPFGGHCAQTFARSSTRTRLATALGLGSQAESSFTEQAAKGLSGEGELEYRHADIDFDDLDPRTVRWLDALAGLLNSRDFREVVQRYEAAQPTLESNMEIVMADILHKRNRHLLEAMRSALEDHPVIIVPWGAMHMPELQREILQWGFEETSRTRRQAIHFENKALIRLVALMDRLPAAPEP